MAHFPSRLPAGATPFWRRGGAVARGGSALAVVATATFAVPAAATAKGVPAGGGLVEGGPIKGGPAKGGPARGRPGAEPGPADTVTTLGELTGSATTVTLDPTTVTALKSAGVTVAPAGTAQALDQGAAISFPISSGYVEVHSERSFRPAYLLGSVEAYGSGLTFSAPAGTVTVTDFVVDLGESTVYATVGSTEDVPLFALHHTHLRVRSSGRAITVSGTEARLTPTAASALDAAFHISAVTPYLDLGPLSLEAAGKLARYAYQSGTTEIPRLSGISASVTLGAAFRGLLSRLGVTWGAAGSGSAEERTDQVTLPVTGGTAVVHAGLRGKAGYLGGVVLLEGSGLVLAHGSTTLSLTGLTVEPGEAAVAGSVNGGPDSSVLFKLGDARAQVSHVGGNLHIRGLQLTLAAGAAAALDSAFDTTLFHARAELGTLAVVASGG